MKTVTICGSMKYEREMQLIALWLEFQHGWNVLQCTYNPRQEPLSHLDIQALKRAHEQKIDLSDGIYVVDIQGYIGESTRNEIEYAKRHHKEIILHSQFGRLFGSDGPSQT